METNGTETRLELRLKPVLIEEELKSSFLDYAMSVVVSRAIPDVRDGLKPVHRRVLYAMHQLGFFYNRSYHKSVRVVGDVLAKYHPHGDQAVYQTMVGMVQNFSKRYPLLDGQGNWGSQDGDSAAAMRYTEVRMQKIAQELLTDIDKETVEFVPNFDESTVEPVILPSRIPHLLVNGTAGIAVGMATSIPPHNLGEVVSACIAMLHDSNISDETLFSLIPAPDFPTGGMICGRGGIVKAYSTGRGSLRLRAIIEVEETKKGGQSLIIKELPYQMQKSSVIMKIADLVRDKIIEGITHIRDESNKEGVRVVIEIKRGEDPALVMNQLFKYTELESSVNFMMLGLLDNRPRIFALRDIIREFLIYRETIITKRTKFELKKAQAREHIIQGFIKALNSIEEIIAAIKSTQTTEEASQKLIEKFELSTEQAKAILEMRLQRLTGLERKKLQDELLNLAKEIDFFRSILSDRTILIGQIEQELVEIKNLYADKRRTIIADAAETLDDAALIADEDVVVTLTRKGYIKRVLLETYNVQHRGGKGKMGMTALDDSDDVVEDIFIARTHDEVLFFTNTGRIYGMFVYEIPEGSRLAKGRALVNVISLQEGESVVKIVCARNLENQFMVMVTKLGVIKRTPASLFAKIRTTGIRAVTLQEGDELAFCALSTGADSIVLATAHGMGIRFVETEVRSMGRQAAGVRGIRLKKDDRVVGMEVVSDDKDILFATAHGYGKRVRVGDFRVAHRGGMGVRTIPTNERNGEVIGLVIVDDLSTLLLIDVSGKIIRLPSSQVRTMGRQAQGVRLTRLDEGQLLAGVVASHDEEASAESSETDQSATEQSADEKSIESEEVVESKE
ncbi:MAG: gyrase subunit A protein [candidate division TM6 bacterium GW2011_GWE2_41_16]|nr:MAG: gyrase subunit A protein [candidate division TM6 bacterium GW2011_GWE2_41_16]